MVNLTKNQIESNAMLEPGLHANVDAEEVMQVEKAVLEDTRVRSQLAELELPKNTVVVVEPWIYGEFFCK